MKTIIGDRFATESREILALFPLIFFNKGNQKEDFMKLNRKRLCECGCGESVKIGNVFIQGHNLGVKGRIPWNKGKTYRRNKQ